MKGECKTQSRVQKPTVEVSWVHKEKVANSRGLRAALYGRNQENRVGMGC